MPVLSRWRLAIVVGAVAIVTAAVFMPLARFGVDPHHDGLLFKGALDVLSGQVPLRDSFAQYGALLPVLQAAFLWVFGPTLLVLKGSTVAFYALSAGVMVALWRTIVPLSVAIGVWTLWLAMQPEMTETAIDLPFSGVVLPWSSVYALGTSLAACLLLVAARLHSRWLLPSAVASGALAAVTVHLRTPTGLAITVALVFGVLAWLPGARPWVKRMLGWFLLSFVLTNGVVIGWLAAVGALRDWWQQVFVWPRQWSEGAGGSPAAFLWGFLVDRVLPVVPQLLFFLGLLAILTLAVSALRVRVGDCSPAATLGPIAAWACVTAAMWLFAWDWLRTWFALDTVMLASVAVAAPLGLVSVGLLVGWLPTRYSPSFVAWAGRFGPLPLVALFSCASLVQIFPIPDGRHLYWSVTPALGLVAWVAYLASRRDARLLILVSLTLFAPALVGAGDRAVERTSNFPADVAYGPERLAGMRVTPTFNMRYAPLIRELEEQYSERPQAPITGTTREPLWLTLGANQTNAEKYFMRFGGFPPVAPDPVATGRFIEKERPLLLIENWPGWPEPIDLTAYRSRVGYVQVGGTQRLPGAAPIALLEPTSRVRRPPFLCPMAAPGCSRGPAVPGIVFLP